MTALDYRPRPAWTDGETRDRKSYPFMRSAGDGSYRRTPMPLWETEQLLEREARELGAARVVIEVVAPDRAFRLDGKMRADAKVEHPGVIVSLDSRHGPLRYATDRMARWQDNLRAIALSLEALRKVDRYGVTKRGEQYTGWKQLGGGTVIVPEQTMTVDEAARVLADLARTPDIEPVPSRLIENPGLIQVAYRIAARRHHPDVGGDRATWDRLEQAKRVLDQHTDGAA